MIGVNNQVRDRLVAGLSQRIDFVKVSPGGNMEKLAKMATKAGRKIEVY
jgi:DNA processing protein